MKKPIISIICALAQKNRAIGKNNKLLVQLPEDLARFKKITFGHPVIMGLNTYESLPFLLPGRTNIVLSFDEIEIEGAIIARTLEEAIEIAAKEDNDEIFIIGGASVYSQTIKIADRLYLTLIDGNFEADAFFPDYSNFKKVLSEEEGQSNGYSLKYLVLEK
jgi:dihydrofolate reductase